MGEQTRLWALRLRGSARPLPCAGGHACAPLAAYATLAQHCGANPKCLAPGGTWRRLAAP